MGQDSEAAAEFVATVRNEHVAMKTWYMGDSPAAKALQEKYGPYPGLWKEVLNWPGWKDARKEYLKQQQQQEQTTSQQTIPRKRKSRWGTVKEEGGNEDSNKRQSRWNESSHNNNNNNSYNNATAPHVPLPVLPGQPAHLPPEKQEELKRLQARLRQVNEHLDNVEREAARVDTLPRGHRERSPSPPPVYGPDGKRKNTRAVRWRERYSAERQDILEKIMNLNPSTTSRQNPILVRKRTKKIHIPIEKHPTYNFIGLLIGPRGKTQKELEAKTGCKIAIRGRGSVKEGARGRRDGKVMEGDNEPLHVVITGDDQRSLDAASDMIEQMLVVIDDEKNVHKQQQLRELALLNGTLKEDEFCQICAEKGHRSFECPRRFALNSKQTVAVKCAICGDTSHPTRDCKQKPTEQKNQQELDSEYSSFMAELEGKKAAPEQPVTNGSLPPPAEKAPPLPNNATELPPPPPGPPPAPGLPLPSTFHPTGNLPPPPPSNLPPPSVAPAAAGYNGNAQGNQYYPTANGGYAPSQQGYPNQQPYMQQQGQQPQQVQPGQETAHWDPSSYYSSYGTTGLNWWEQ